MAAGDPVGAETHLAAALASSAHPWIVANRAALEKTLARARSQIGDLAIDGGPRGAAVSANGHPVGTLPLDSPIRLAAGRIEIAVSAPNHATVTRAVQLVAGEHQRLTINLERVLAGPSTSSSPSAGPAGGVASLSTPGPAGAAPSAPPGTTATLASAPSGSTPASGAPPGRPAADLRAEVPPGAATGLTRTAAWATAGAAVAGLGVGLGLELAALSKNSEFKASCGLDDHNNPVPKSSVMPQQCTDLRNTWNTERTWSIVGYAGGAALAVTSGLLFWSSRPAANPNIHARLQCVPGIAGISCRGEF
jgi:hypothetical protein